jgi:hypothetical protein
MSNTLNFKQESALYPFNTFKNIFMRNACLQLYQKMVNDTSLEGSLQSDFPGWAKHCFRVSALAGIQLQKMIEDYSFTDEGEKRWVLITLKPLFSGWGEYFTLIYTAELFVPEDPAKKMEYWNRELGKTWNFLMKHEKFYLSYKGKLSQEAPDDGRTAGFDNNLAAMIMAKAKYMEYVQDKLTELRGRRQNSLLLRA